MQTIIDPTRPSDYITGLSPEEEAMAQRLSKIFGCNPHRCAPGRRWETAIREAIETNTVSVVAGRTEWGAEIRENWPLERAERGLPVVPSQADMQRIATDLEQITRYTR